MWLRSWLPKVAPSTSERTRDGYCSASSCAIMPPIEIPKTLACAIPAASSTRAASSARSRMRKPPGEGEDDPMPRLSKTTTWNHSASLVGSVSQASEPIPSPMMRRSGGAPGSPKDW